MKIVEVISDTNIGGAGVLLINRLKHTDRKKYCTVVLLPMGSKLVARLRDINVDFIETDCRGDKSFDMLAVIRYVKVIKHLKPDIINSHGCLSARIAAFLCGVPIKICTRHCFFSVPEKNMPLTKIKGILNSALSDKFIAVAYAAKENLESLNVDSKKIKVIINGAEPIEKYSDLEKNSLRLQMDIKETSCVLCMCARLEPCKGHEIFLKTVKLLIDDGVDCTAIIVGDGNLKNKLQELCQCYGIENNVIFTGFVNDVTPYMNISDINVNCSIGTETSSLALSEGMSIGLPAVVSDYGGNPYMVKHGVNGFVYSCGDHKSMAEYIKALVFDRELYSKMSSESRKRFECELNAISMTEKTHRLYDELYYMLR